MSSYLMCALDKLETDYYINNLCDNKKYQIPLSQLLKMHHKSLGTLSGVEANLKHICEQKRLVEGLLFPDKRG